jgi:hypothetical protein
MIPMTTSRRTATQRHSWSILSYGTAISISMATGTWPAVGPPGHATTSPRSACRRLWRSVERLGFTGGRVPEPGTGTEVVIDVLV